ncbi:FecR domain-containing protein [Oryzomonas sagensis]|uniref:FecR domain-containing protein n=1 Tax=Oryzomonas sagensis TaxID=2603857 RepID=A0ABQ6TNB6_9BACT|nr:FecR family protein [Oryzomonas sagensis]KAB0670114.1 FecR domain-containing protein [Oryzomonas sagensis]
MKTIFFGLLLLFSAASAFAAPTDVIGHVQTMKGSASFLRGTLTQPAVIGGGVHRGDVVRTAKDGSLGIVLADDTTLSLGPNSELAIKEYVFDPKDGKFTFLARMAKGTFVYLSGLMAKLAPHAIRLEIPEATIAVRGTRLLIEVQE